MLVTVLSPRLSKERTISSNLSISPNVKVPAFFTYQSDEVEKPKPLIWRGVCVESQDINTNNILFHDWEDLQAAADHARFRLMLTIQQGWAPVQSLPMNDPWFQPHCWRYREQPMRTQLRTPSIPCSHQISSPRSRTRVQSWSSRSAPKHPLCQSGGAFPCYI